MTLAEFEQLSLKSAAMAIIKAKKHDLGYPQGYDGEYVPSFSTDVQTLGQTFVAMSWVEEDASRGAALNIRLGAMTGSDKFTADEVIFLHGDNSGK